MTEIKRSETFDLAFKFITQTNKNVFLTGKAGTGKTTFLKYLKSHTHKNMVVAAPTGVAAINAGGVTLHSLFQLPFAPFIPSSNATENTLHKHPLLSQIRLNSQKRKILVNMDLLVIDEVSMVAANTLDSIDIILKSVRKNFNYPFGGVQVLFIGDLRQLPPVVKNFTSGIFQSIYKSYFFFDSLVLSQYTPVMVELKTIYRQKDDNFVDILNGVRENQLTPKHLETLNKRLKPDFTPETNAGYITLTTHNSQADTLNQAQINQLKEREYIFKAEIKDDFPQSMYPADADLVLKKGAQVMFLKNDTEEKQYFNGKIGTVSYITHNEIHVKCKEDPGAIIVQKDEWKNVHYKVDSKTREVNEEVLGLFKQYPLRLAWAITIHKSQGLTFDKLVVDAQKAFANGQVYVALSRGRSLDGLVLTSPISQQFLGANQNLKNWENHHNKPEGLSELLENSKIDCIQTECIRIFDWYNTVQIIASVDRIVKREKEQLNPEVPAWSDDILNQIMDLNKVAKTFQTSIINLTLDPEFRENQNQFQKRLKDAADYFLPKIEIFKEVILNHPIACKTKKTSIEFDEPFEELGSFLHDLIHQLKYLEKENFDLDEYLKTYRVNKGPTLKIKKTHVDKPKKSQSLVSAAEIEHINLYQQLALYRKEKAGKKGTPIYKIFSNKAVKEMCEFLPRTEEGLFLVNGLGKVTIDLYGNDLIEIISTYCDDKDIGLKDLFG